MSGVVIVLHFNVPDFIGLVHFQWGGENKVGNIGIPVLWRVCEKPY